MYYKSEHFIKYKFEPESNFISLYQNVNLPNRLKAHYLHQRKAALARNKKLQMHKQQYDLQFKERFLYGVLCSEPEARTPFDTYQPQQR